MTWSEWSNFFAMGGYGFYVWGSYFVALVCLTVEVIWVIHRRRRALENVLTRKVSSASQAANNEAAT